MDCKSFDSTNIILKLSIDIKINIIYIMSREDQIRKQNKQLRSEVQGYLEQIDRLKQVNQQHQSEIETLLKFNERLLIIIETQLNSYNSRKSERSLSLQPISQITQKDSQVIQAMGSIKASIINQGNLRGFQLQLPQKMMPGERRSGGQTDRVILGENLSDALSYQISRSDYQKQYSQYSQKQKVREVIALINTYKKQYGESIKQCQIMKAKIKQDAEKDNIEIQNLNQQNQTFYGSKMAQVTNLKQKMKDSTLQNQLHKIIQSNKYSSKTQSKLMKIIGQIN